MSSTIAEQVDRMNAERAGQLPEGVAAAFGAEQRGLAAAGPPAATITAGTPLPDAELLDVHGKPTTLTSARDGRPAVIVFYRGEWCPYCNLTLRTYQAELQPRLAELGFALIAISPRAPDGALTMQEKHELTFTVLSDPGAALIRAVGVLTEPSADVRAAQLDLGLDVAAGNADGTCAMPMPTVLVVDADGIVRWVDVHPDYTTRTEVSEILTAVTHLSA